jgi:hypothetical protein
MNSQAVIVSVTHVLHEHECAVIPGFGAFILRKNFGMANPFSGQLKPAAYSIYFNSDIKEDDGFVANALKEQFGYSFKQASQLLFDFGLNILEQTEKVSLYRLGELGSFHRNPAGELFFLADTNLNLSLQTFGLPHIQWQWKSDTLPTQVSKTFSAPNAEIAPNLPIVDSKITSASAQASRQEVINKQLEPPSTEIDLNETEHHSSFTVSKRSQPLLWRAAASFAIISIGAGILMTIAQIWSVSSGQDLASLMPQDTQTQAIKPQLLQSKVDEVQIIQESNKSDSLILHKVNYGMGNDGITAFYQALKSINGKYKVTGGSYITLELANRECKLWQKIGIDACVVPVKRSSLNKVVLGVFDKETHASDFAESIKNMPTGTLTVSEVSLDWK